LSHVGVRTSAAGIVGIRAALNVIGDTLSHVGMLGDAASVELILALTVGGGQRDGGKSQGEEGGEADHCEICRRKFESWFEESEADV
jgi:hypothetical protein